MKKHRTLSPETCAKISAAAKLAHATRRAAGLLHRGAGPPWTPAEDAQLGTAPDAEISARTGRSLGSIAARRHKLGIASPSRPGRPFGWRKSVRC